MSLVLRAECPSLQTILPREGKNLKTWSKLGLAKAGTVVLIETRTVFSIMYTFFIHQSTPTVPMSFKQGLSNVENPFIHS